jgi:hypothetical protein
VRVGVALREVEVPYQLVELQAEFFVGAVSERARVDVPVDGQVSDVDEFVDLYLRAEVGLRLPLLVHGLSDEALQRDAPRERVVGRGVVLESNVDVLDLELDVIDNLREQSAGESRPGGLLLLALLAGLVVS